MAVIYLAIDKELMEAVAEGNISHIRNALTIITRNDRGFQTGAFDEALNYVENQNISGLYDEFDGEEEKPESEWDKDYWTYVNASLMDNFCKERINLLKRIGNKIYPSSSNSAQVIATPRTPTPVSRPVARPVGGTQKKTNTRSSSRILMGTAGVMAVTAVGCIVVGAKIPVTIGLLAVEAVAGGVIHHLAKK